MVEGAQFIRAAAGLAHTDICHNLGFNTSVDLASTTSRSKKSIEPRGMPALNQLRLVQVASRVAHYPAPAAPAAQAAVLSQPGTYARRLSSVHQIPPSPRSNTSFDKPLLQTTPATPSTANMSTMPASHGHSEACCNVPPIVSKGYNAKGSYEEIDGLKTCTTPSISSRPSCLEN